MSQLVSVFGLDWRLLFIQAFNFAVLLAVLWYFLYRPVLRIIDERRAKVAEGVRVAEAAAQKLEEAKRKGDEVVVGAVREGEKIVADARATAQVRGGAIVSAAEARAAAALKEAQMKGEEAKRLAIESSEREIARAAMLAAEKILREKSA
jgi:F-type H+-transporting ATPase subunit b